MDSILYKEDINKITSECLEVILGHISYLDVEEENKIFDVINDVLCAITDTYEYRNQMG